MDSRSRPSGSLIRRTSEARSIPPIAMTGTSWGGSKKSATINTGVVGTAEPGPISNSMDEASLSQDAGDERDQGGVHRPREEEPSQNTCRLREGQPDIGVRVRLGHTPPALRPRDSSTAWASSRAPLNSARDGGTSMAPRQEPQEQAPPAHRPQRPADLLFDLPVSYRDLNGSTKTSSIFHVAGVPLVVKISVRFWVPLPASRSGIPRTMVGDQPADTAFPFTSKAVCAI